MFLDGQLRALAAEKKRLVLRGELGRRLLRLECGLAKAAACRRWSDAAAGAALLRRILAFVRGRGPCR